MFFYFGFYFCFFFCYTRIPFKFCSQGHHRIYSVSIISCQVKRNISTHAVTKKICFFNSFAIHKRQNLLCKSLYSGSNPLGTSKTKHLFGGVFLCFFFSIKQSEDAHGKLEEKNFVVHVLTNTSVSRF